MDKQNMKQNDQYKQPQQQNHNHQQQQRFPITKPGLCGTNPKFPYRDLRHYTDPCCDFPKKCQYGKIAQIALSQPHYHRDNCHSPELPTSHPWFEPSA